MRCGAFLFSKRKEEAAKRPVVYVLPTSGPRRDAPWAIFLFSSNPGPQRDALRAIFFFEKENPLLTLAAGQTRPKAGKPLNHCPKARCAFGLFLFFRQGLLPHTALCAVRLYLPTPAPQRDALRGLFSLKQSFSAIDVVYLPLPRSAMRCGAISFSHKLAPSY